MLASFSSTYYVGLIPSPITCWPHSQAHTMLASFPAPYCVGLIPSPLLCWPHFPALYYVGLIPSPLLCWPHSHTVLASFPAPYCVGLIPSPLLCWPHSQPPTVLASFSSTYCVDLIPSPIPCWPHSQPPTVLASFSAPYCVGLIPSPLQKQWEEDLSSKCWVSMLWGAYLVGRAHIVRSVLPWRFDSYTPTLSLVGRFAGVCFCGVPGRKVRKSCCSCFMLVQTVYKFHSDLV